MLAEEKIPAIADVVSYQEASRNRPRLSQGQMASMNLFWFANNVLWAGLLAVVLPSQVAKLIPGNKDINLPLVVAWGTLVAIVANPLFGALSDRLSSRLGRRKTFMVVATVPNVVFLMAMALVGHLTKSAILPAMAVSFVFVQLFNNMANSPWSAIIADKAPESQLGAAAGWFGLMTLLGTIVGAELCGFILNSNSSLAAYNQQLLIVYGVISIIQLLFVALTVVLVPEERFEARASFTRFKLGEFVRGFWISPRQYPDFGWVFLTRFMVMQGIWAVEFFLLYYFRDVIQVSDPVTTKGLSPESMVGTFIAIVTVAAAIITYFGGSISDRMGRKLMVYISGSAMTVVCLIFIFLHLWYAALVGAFFFGIGYGAYTSVDQALATAVLPKATSYGKDMGIWSIAGILPQVLGLVVGGLLLAATSALGAAKYDILFGGTVVLFAAGTYFVNRVKCVK